MKANAPPRHLTGGRRPHPGALAAFAPLAKSASTLI
jgi:hypothetical protein